ncbi:MAG: hypothetical protein ACSHWY_01210 [Octadecabacter sp.]
MSEGHGLSDGESGWLNLRMPDGNDWGPVNVSGVFGDPLAVLVDLNDFSKAVDGWEASGFYNADPRSWMVTEETLQVPTGGSQTLDGQQVEATRAIVGRNGSEALRCLALDVIPREGGQVEVLAVEDRPEVHEADQQELPDSLSPTYQLTNSDAPIWSGVEITTKETSVTTASIFVSGPAVIGAASYQLETSGTTEPLSWAASDASTTPQFQSAQIVQDVYVRVAAQSDQLRGTWLYFKTDLNASVDGIAAAIQIPDPT